MTRKGRDLEKLVSNFEKLLGPKGVEVKSPDYLPDRDTGEPREVDISLRSQIGSSEILVIVECRDYLHKVQDVKWIEELATKRESVGADKILAVSSTGFSRPAIKKAKIKGIILRNIDEIDYHEISHWFSFKYLYFDRPNYRIYKVKLNTPDEGEFNRFLKDNPDIKLDSKIYINRKGRKLSIDDLLLLGFQTDQADAKQIWHGLSTNGEKKDCKILLNFEDKGDIRIETDFGDIEVSHAIIYTELWIERNKIPISPIKSYSDETGKILACTGRFECESPDGTLIIDIKRAGSQVFMDAKVKKDTEKQLKS